jgi:hypothetical protein
MQAHCMKKWKRKSGIAHALFAGRRFAACIDASSIGCWRLDHESAFAAKRLIANGKACSSERSPGLPRCLDR